MIDINKIKGKNVMYTGELSELLTNGSFYTIGIDEDDGLFTIDDEGDYHSLTPDYIELAFDAEEYTTLVGKYVRYLSDKSECMRQGDIGIVVQQHGSNGLGVRWLNPIAPHTEECSEWFAATCHVEFV